MIKGFLTLGLVWSNRHRGGPGWGSSNCRGRRCELIGSGDVLGGAGGIGGEWLAADVGGGGHGEMEAGNEFFF